MFIKLILFFLVIFLLIGLGVLGIVLRGFFAVLYWLRGGARTGDGAGGTHFGGRTPKPAKTERILACAMCGVHVPESEGVSTADKFFCCDAHRRARGETGDQ
ncbi:MAG: hypothetical protein LBT71_09450 [Azoarcus sp.]|nr:hypothetical protein [Azoarcus sp.]